MFYEKPKSNIKNKIPRSENRELKTNAIKSSSRNEKLSCSSTNPINDISNFSKPNSPRKIRK